MVEPTRVRQYWYLNLYLQLIWCTGVATKIALQTLLYILLYLNFFEITTVLVWMLTRGIHALYSVAWSAWHYKLETLKGTLHIKINLLVTRRTTQPVKTVVKCLLLLWRGFVKSYKITLMMSKWRHQGFSRGLETTNLSLKSNWWHGAEDVGVHQAGRVYAEDATELQDIWLCCSNVDYSILNLSLMSPPTLWKCNTKTLYYT